MPPNIQIEITNFCNSKCTICPIKNMKRKRGVMEFVLFKKIIDECKENNFSGIIAPFLEGEPFITPKILTYLKYIRKQIPKAKVGIFSNGSKLTDKLASEIIKEELLDTLVISFDGGTKETYENIRVGLSFDETRNNVQNFLKLRKKFKKKKPFVEISMVVTKENKKTMKLLEEEFKDADKVSFHKFFNWAGQMKKSNKNYKNSKIRNFFVKRNVCNRLDSAITILFNGDVALCCWDYEGKVILGNIKNSTIKEIWNSEKLKNIRKALKEREFEKLPLCYGCDFINQNPLYRQIIKTEAFLRKFPRLYKFMKNFYVTKV